MKTEQHQVTVAVLLMGLLALVVARPDTIVDLDDNHQEVSIEDDDTVTGIYR